MPSEAASLTSFTVCRVEAGRAVLLSQDFQVMELPASLLPVSMLPVSLLSSPAEECGNRMVRVQVTDATDLQQTRLRTLAQHVAQLDALFGIDATETQAIRQTIGADDFVRVERRGATAVTLTWRQAWDETCSRMAHGRILLHAVDVIDGPRGALGRLSPSPAGRNSHDAAMRTSCRVNLPDGDAHELTLQFRTSAGVFVSRPVTAQTLPLSSTSYASLFLLTDLAEDDARLQRVRVLGAVILDRTTSMARVEAEPITAVVTDSLQSPLCETALHANLPVVGGSWLDALLAEHRIPVYADHPVVSKNSK